MVSDNGAGFTSSEFQTFLKRNGIRYVTSAPYHPASNGLAERAVQTFKNNLKKCQDVDIETQLARFLFKYRNTPHTTTGVTPAELLMGRKPRTHLSLIHPNLAVRVQRQQENQKFVHDQRTKHREFNIGDPVMIRDFTTNELKWIPGTIVTQRGALIYHIELPDGRVVRRHIDHIRKHTVGETPSIPEDDYLPPVSLEPQEIEEPTPQPSQSATPLRRSTRVSRPPDRLQN